MLRIGRTIYHMGFNGWESQSGSEGVKGLLFSNPYARGIYQTFVPRGVPPFSVGITLRLPKRGVEALQQIVEAKVNAVGDERIAFDFVRNNCNQLPLRAFAEAGISIGDASGMTGLSSSLTARRLFLHPPAPVAVVNVYPIPGVELTDSEYRDYFPAFLYRHHTVAADIRQSRYDEDDRNEYRDVLALNAIAIAAHDGAAKVFENLQPTHLFDEQDFARSMSRLAQKGWIDAEPLTLTEAGRAAWLSHANDYELPSAPPN